MADPFTLAAISIGTTLAAGAVSAVGASYQASANANMANYQAAVARNNALIAQHNADYELERGEVEAQRQALKDKAERGQIVAAIGASGLDLSSGSAADVRTSSEKLGQYNQAIIRSDASRKSYAYLTQKMEQQAESQLYSAKAKYAKTAGEFGVASSLLGTAASVSDKWYKYRA